MPRKSPTKPKPKLTDKERHERFLAMAEAVEASNSDKDFDAAFRKVAKRPTPKAVRQGGS